MTQLKTAFFDFIRGDKATLIVVVTKIIVAFLFSVACLLPYMVSPDLIDGSLSSSDFPGGGLYTFIFFGSIIGFAYVSIIRDEKHANWILIGQAILATFIYFYSLLFHKVGLAEASNGFGKVLEFFLVIIYWFLIFGNKYVSKWTQMVLSTKRTEGITPKTMNVIEKPKKMYIPKSVELEQANKEQKDDGE